MCGIAGFLDASCTGKDQLTANAIRMASTLVHRGPDDAGVWIDEDVGISFAHRRLSIIDPSPAGHQPMISRCGRYVVTFNGEIYNHEELRTALPERTWRGHSDTETLLDAISVLGIERAVQACVGAFAFALWDRKTRTLTLARDRMGEKPLYYGWHRGVFLFASELKALRAHPSFKGEIDRNSVALLLRHNYVPTPFSIYQDIRKLPAGTLLQLNSDRASGNEGLDQPRPYWSLRDVVEAGQGDQFKGGDAEAVNTLEQLLLRAVRQQMMADVPLGAFLSGGVDSSTIVALMQAQSANRVKTFTIGFRESGFDEADHAKIVAKHLGTEHTELYVSPDEAIDVIPRLPMAYDEPFADSSQVPTLLVSALARRHVTVCLSGDAGDELFAGYNRYFIMRQLWSKFSWLPDQVRRGIGHTIAAIPLPALDRIGSLMTTLSEPSEKARKIADILMSPNLESGYRRLVSHWNKPAELAIGATEPQTLLTNPAAWPNIPGLEKRMMFLDSMTYLPDDILCKVDRASMASSLETRVPFLDHRVVEFAWRLPLAMKIRNGTGKWILRQLLYKYVPKQLIERPKMGFAIPIASWLRGPLREWAEDLLDESRLRHEGYLNPEKIRRKWKEHVSGKKNWHYILWDVLMFQAWLEHSKRQSNESSAESYALMRQQSGRRSALARF